MAVTTTFAIATSSTSNTTSYASGAFTPAAGDLLLVFAMAGATTAAASMTDSQSLGFTKVGSAVASTSTDTMYCFVSNKFAAASSMTVTFDCTGDAADGCVIIVFRLAGMTRSGEGAVRQTAKQDNQAASGTPAPAFAVAALTGNPTYGGIMNSSNPAAMTPPTSWTENASADTGYNTPTTGAEAVYRDSGFTGTTITWGGTSATAFCSLIIEMRADAKTQIEDDSRVSGGVMRGVMRGMR